MKKILIFNHKGGVSKTTSTYNIGWMIAEMGHKVLLVDADPQCNLTALLLADQFDSYYEDEDTKDDNIKTGVTPAFENQPRAIAAVKCYNSTRNDNLFLLPGHMNLSELDAALNLAFTSAQSIPVLKSLPGAFNDLIEKTANEVGAEYVLIDLNPGLSAINQDMFIISDAFIIPTNPDAFSILALKSLSVILPRWVNWKKQNIDKFRDAIYPLPEGTPKFIGTIPQRFNIRNGQPTAPFKDKIQELSQITINTVVPAFKNAEMVFDDEGYKNSNIPLDTYKLGEIKDFTSLAVKSYEAHVPVFALRDAEIRTQGAVLTAQKENRDTFHDIYQSITDKIIRLLKE